jgi:hypothetical protein
LLPTPGSFLSSSIKRAMGSAKRDIRIESFNHWGLELLKIIWIVKINGSMIR